MKGYWIALVALAFAGCTPDWAQRGDSVMVLLLTAINDGSPMASDVRISDGTACPDFATLRVENHFKNPSLENTGFRGDITIERYEVRYFRSDGRNQEGVDVPYRITGNVAQEIIAPGAATLLVEVVRPQAKLEPPLANLKAGGGPLIVTMFAEVTLHARTTTLQATNSVSARMQIDFADFGDNLTACPTAPGGGA
jgi:hypothetical protein